MRSTQLAAVLSCGLAVALGGCSGNVQSAIAPQAQTVAAPHAQSAVVVPMTVSTARGMAAITRTVSIPFGGLDRSYIEVAPPNADPGSLPLVVVLHGAFVTGSAELARTGFGQLAEEGKAVVVAPESVGPAWNSDAGCCNVAAANHVDDTTFVSTVIGDVQRSAHTDPRRTSVVGYSSGGKLAYNVACVNHPALAAVATYGAGPQLPCRNTTPLTVVVGYGDQDTNEPMLGAPHNTHGMHQPQSETVAQQRDRDGCAAAQVQHSVGPTTITTWTSCHDQNTVTQVIWHGSTHQWPGSAPDVPPAASGEALYWPLLAAARTS